MTSPSGTASLDLYLSELRTIVNEALPRALPVDAPATILDAMRYALLGGGKRLRPCLTLATADAVAEKNGRSPSSARPLALPAACAIEFVHAYSLVHDDLPAMDDDALRRGRPTSHVVHGEGLAILAGDGLLTEAFALLAQERPRVVPASAPSLPLDARLRSLQVLAGAAGAAGMVGGQAIDLAAAGKVKTASAIVFSPTPASGDDSRGRFLRDMHARKTGALIRAAAALGAIAADADSITLALVDDFARELGLAFQIVDDVLDVEGSPEELGKTIGKDAVGDKLTYPSVYGLDQSRRLAAESVARAKHALTRATLGGRLAEIADWSLTRRH